MAGKDPKNRMSRRRFLQGTGLLVGATVLASCGQAEPEVVKETVEVVKEVTKEVPVVTKETVEVVKEVTAVPKTLEAAALNIWINWGGVWQEAIEQIVAGFIVDYPQIEVELLPGVSGSEGRTKFLASVAAGNPPDLFTTHAYDGRLLTSRGVLLSMDPYMATSQVSRDDFFDTQLNLYVYEGQLYGIPSIEGAAGQGLVWNKAHFREVGLDPEQPPTTHAEIEEYAQMLDQTDSAGNIVRLGFDPRDGRGWSLLDWWFERDWYDEENAKLNIYTDNLVWGAEWVASFARRVGPENMNAFRQEYGTYTGSPESGFVRQAQSMIMNGYYVAGELNRLAPEIEAGFTWVPTLDNKKVTTMRGWFWVMPRGCPNPDAAWAFVEHGTSVEAAFTIFNVAGGYPSYKPFLEVAAFDKYPGMRWFVDSPNNADVIYIAPVLPISSDEVDDRINAGLDEMSFGSVTADEVLQRAQEECQKLIDQALET